MQNIDSEFIVQYVVHATSPFLGQTVGRNDWVPARDRVRIGSRVGMVVFVLGSLGCVSGTSQR